jgi:hypothetical protein
MLKFLKKVDWERVIEIVGFVFITAIGLMLFTFAFVFGKAIIEAVF